MTAVNKLQIGQHQRLKQEQQVFLNPMHNQVTIMTNIGRKRANPYNHGEMHAIAVSNELNLTSDCMNDGTIATT